ncbi:MAG: hypothetical protein RIR18_1842 [Pseudomonadota bacterium]|jgi:CyaY protein
MNEQEFKEVSEQTLQAIESALENCDADLDFEWQGDGVLEISFENRSKIIVNRHSAAQEIWVAARSGGFHFKREAGQWLDTRDNQPLAEKLSALVSQQSGESIALLI